METITGILLSLIGILIIFLFIYWVFIHPIKYEYVLRKFENELKIGDKFSSGIILLPDDPFEDDEREITVEILDMKRNYKGELFVKVKWSDNNISTMFVDKLYNDFTKIKKQNYGISYNDSSIFMETLLVGLEQHLQCTEGFLNEL